MQNTKPHKKWYKKWWAISLFTILTIILILIIALTFYIIDLTRTIKNDSHNGYLLVKSLESQTKPNLDLIENKNNYWLGSAKPKITIVEFGDFNCPLCGNSYHAIRRITTEYKDSVKIIFRDFPILENSIELAMAGRCAGEQGLFWLMHDKLYQKQNNIDINNLDLLANEIGADVEKFNQCIKDNKYLDAIHKDFSDAETLEIAGTPTFFINGYRIEGDVPYDIWQKIIQEMIK